VPTRLVSTLVLVGVLCGCSFGKASFSLPDRSDPVVKQEEVRIALALAADTSGELLSQPLPGPAHCRVRLLRQVGTADYVYAECTAGQSGFSFPLKLDGSSVTVPRDGSEYAPSIRRIFPSDIAAALIEDEQRYKP